MNITHIPLLHRRQDNRIDNGDRRGFAEIGPLFQGGLILDLLEDIPDGNIQYPAFENPFAPESGSREE
jgi:hypothetical protein